MKKQIFNPYLPDYEYVPDGEPRVFDGRLYIYGSHDAFDGPDFCVNDYVTWSAPLNNLTDWRYEGVIYKALQDPRNKKGKMHMCAPDCVKGSDGRYYLYYQLHKLTCTSVAVSERPAGPFEFYGYVQHPDHTPWGERKGDTFAFDPGVLVEENGDAYIYLGFAPEGFMKTVFRLRGNKVDGSVCLKLERDMKTVTGEEMPIVPGPLKSKGTNFEGHAFFEASSMRKIGDTYYYVYSSELSHELCYATSKSPDRDFTYGGTLVSVGDVGLRGNQVPVNYTGNTHGGMAEIDGQWYIFYHRQTNKQKCARQGCAEMLCFHEDGSIGQAEITSCGLNKGALPGRGTYPASIACNLSSKEGTFAYEKQRHKDKKGIHPYFTQKLSDQVQKETQFIANINDGAWAGYKYFDFTDGSSVIRIRADGNAKGTILVFHDRKGTAIAEIGIHAEKEAADFSAPIKLSGGIKALYFLYRGEGYLNFYSFTIE